MIDSAGISQTLRDELMQDKVLAEVERGCCDKVGNEEKKRKEEKNKHINRHWCDLRESSSLLLI